MPATSDTPGASNPAAVKGVLFDLGGTLFTYHGMPSRSGQLLMNAASQLGIDAPPKKIGMTYQQANKDVAVAYGSKDYYLHADLFKDVFIAFCEGLGGTFNPEVWEAYRHEHDAAVIDALQIRDDCRATLQSLRERGLYLSIASNIDHFMLEALVEREDLHLLFDDWTSSEEASSCKPHDAFFHYTSKKSGLDHDAILFVGDSPEHDILGAHSVGMRTTLIVEPGVTAPLQSGKKTVAPDHEINTLSELLEILT